MPAWMLHHTTGQMDKQALSTLQQQILKAQEQHDDNERWLDEKERQLEDMDLHDPCWQELAHAIARKSKLLLRDKRHLTAAWTAYGQHAGRQGGGLKMSFVWVAEGLKDGRVRLRGEGLGNQETK